MTTIVWQSIALQLVIISICCLSAWKVRADEGAPSRCPDLPIVAGLETEDLVDDFSKLIVGLRKQKKLVSLAAMVSVDGNIVSTAVDGEREKGSCNEIQSKDRWHLGSITKSITATMIGRLVEAGRMQWTETVGERFVDQPMHDDWKAVTLRQLLTHTSGASGNFPFWVRLRDPELGDESTQVRREAVFAVIAEKPEFPAGEKFAYSNIGYTIAGAMAEAATGLNWDELVKQEVYQPLALTDAGFGPPKSSTGTMDQPHGHANFFGIKLSANETADNTTIMGPAGIAHMSLGNLCTYATEHLRGHLGQGTLLSAESYQLLHTPEKENYACGWVRKDAEDDIPHTMYWHNGSNTMWYALTVFVPDTKMVICVTTNDGDIRGSEIVAWEIVKNRVLRLHAEKKGFETIPRQEADDTEENN